MLGLDFTVQKTNSHELNKLWKTSKFYKEDSFKRNNLFEKEQSITQLNNKN
jgi:hypothetical protein